MTVRKRYRVVRNSRQGYEIHEIYSEDDGVPTMWSRCPMKPFGDSLDDLKMDLGRMTEALDLPTLEVHGEEYSQILKEVEE